MEETSDGAQKEQVSFILRYKGKFIESFLNFQNVSRTDCTGVPEKPGQI